MSSTVTVDVFLDADPGITLLGINVLASNDAIIDYDAAASAAAPAAGSAGPGAQPSYILYSPPAGKTTPAAILYPQQTPAFLNWPAPPAGQEQVNINYAEPSFGGTFATGTGIWIATLVWHITADFGAETISLSMTEGGGILQTGSTVIPASAIPLSGAIQLTGLPVPEPTTAMLIGLGVLGLTVAGRRRA